MAAIRKAQHFIRQSAEAGGGEEGGKADGHRVDESSTWVREQRSRLVHRWQGSRMDRWQLAPCQRSTGTMLRGGRNARSPAFQSASYTDCETGPTLRIEAFLRRHA